MIELILEIQPVGLEDSTRWDFVIKFKERGYFGNTTNPEQVEELSSKINEILKETNQKLKEIQC